MSVIHEIINIVTFFKHNLDIYTTNNDSINDLYKKIIILLPSIIEELKYHESAIINSSLQELLILLNDIDIYIKKYKRNKKVFNIIKMYYIKKTIISFSSHIDTILKTIKFELNISNNKNIQSINNNMITSFHDIINNNSLNKEQLNIQLSELITNNNMMISTIIYNDIKQYCTLYMNSSFDENNNKNIILIEQQNEKIISLENEIKLLHSKFDKLNINNVDINNVDINNENINNENSIYTIPNIETNTKRKQELTNNKQIFTLQNISFIVLKPNYGIDINTFEEFNISSRFNIDIQNINYIHNSTHIKNGSDLIRFILYRSKQIRYQCEQTKYNQLWNCLTHVFYSYGSFNINNNYLKWTTTSVGKPYYDLFELYIPFLNEIYNITHKVPQYHIIAIMKLLFDYSGKQLDAYSKHMKNISYEEFTALPTYTLDEDLIYYILSC